MNKYGQILPPRIAVALISNMVRIMEQYHASEHLGYETLFEVYQTALSLAIEANEYEKIEHFEKRIQLLSSIHFE